MAIKRVKKEMNYTIINNTGLKDKSLSLKAKGLLAYMLSLPDDWIFYETELIKHSKDGRDSIRGGLKELEDKGYLVRERARDDLGKLKGTDWLLYETPQNVNIPTFPPKTDFPMLGKPMLDNPMLGNPTLLSTDSTKDLPKLNTNNTKDKDNTSNKDSMEVLFKKIWAIYPKKTLRQSGLAAYKKAIKKGVTHEEIEQGVLNYVAYQKLNSSWLKPMDGGRWFQKERWTDEYDMTPPKAYNNSQQSVRTESLPDWAKDDFVPPQTIEDNSEEARQKALEELNSIGRN
ncbi:helix-turn-helix domain-containing protein [Carnobacterium maltaromaticum]